ncbi:ATPase (plasmid) [Pseudarthrobacter chlorophenolicus A6]|uniref:ATPase n=1 Tax=Pseudarthrobacter chlorophenolicus (strain ATCC 700700 / DSM 12829 / CIP 107037 / JCM 12360 / KCTC 9906 / NCIMB 13794 / A6) TaxID=452863 RepID=B8HI38_PSECP|nr:AAA family ATPase [Pseudarthrobacter chlorophenolicus]ACL42085.1 ATPase [Pseudarthrobacter chlorophenolicus A6]SDQ13225.1 MoxR-like ATPase [Pseudarthrobacter chlorophenolicus]
MATINTYPGSPFQRALAAGVQANVPVGVIGEPGQGKTATMESATSGWGRHVETVIGSNREATDFLGVMIEDEGAIKYSSFQWVKNLNDAAMGLLLLDEFNTSAPSTMKGMLRVVQERYVGDTKLSDSVSIVALMNPVETAVDAYDLPAPMANRMMHLKWVFDSKNWLENVGTDFQAAAPLQLSEMLAADPVARKAAVSAAVTTFLKVNSKFLTPPVPTDPVKAGGAWPSPRAWTNVINVLSQLDRYDEEAAFLVVEGLVGEGAATEYFKWLAAADLYDPAEVIDGTVQVNWKNERADRLFALVQGVSALGLSGDAELWRKAALVLAKCAESGKPDVAFPSAQKLANNMPKGVRGIPQSFADAFMELFSNTKYKVAVSAK